YKRYIKNSSICNSSTCNYDNAVYSIKKYFIRKFTMEVKASDILIPRRANALSKKIQEYNRLIGTNPQRVTELYVSNDCGKIGEWIDGLRVNHKCYEGLTRFFIPRII